MPGKGFKEVYQQLPGAATALTASTTQTSLFLGQTGEMSTLGAGYFDRLGKTMDVDIAGKISTVVTTPGTLTLKLRFIVPGGAGIDVWTSGALALNVAAKSAVPWKLSGKLNCRSIGSGTLATLMGILTFTSEAYVGSGAATAGGVASVLVPLAVAVGAGFDSTSAQIIDVQALWSLSNANSINLETCDIEGATT